MNFSVDWFSQPCTARTSLKTSWTVWTAHNGRKKANTVTISEKWLNLIFSMKSNIKMLATRFVNGGAFWRGQTYEVVMIRCNEHQITIKTAFYPFEGSIGKSAFEWTK